MGSSKALFFSQGADLDEAREGPRVRRGRRGQGRVWSLFNDVIYCGISLEAVTGINPRVALLCPMWAGRREDKTEGEKLHKQSWG